MPTTAEATWVQYVCLGSDNKPLAGDLANHTVYWTAGGTRAAATNNQGGAGKHIELGNGAYALLLTAAEANCATGILDGSSVTSGAVVVPSKIEFTAAGAIAFITPLLAGSVSSGAVTTSTALVAYQSRKASYGIPVLDSDGDPVVLTGKSLALVCWPKGHIGDVAFTLTTGGGGLTVSGDDENQVNISLSAANTATAGDFEWELENLTDGVALPQGTLVIKPMPSVPS